MEKSSILRPSELEPLCIIRLLLRNLWLIIMAGLIGFFCSSAFLTADASRDYRSSATFVVTPNSGSYYSTLYTSVTAAKTYAPLLQSNIMYQLISASSEEPLHGTISASALGSTNLISVSVTADTPKDSLLMMQAIADNYGMLSQYVSASASLAMLDTPSLSTQITNTFTSRALVPYATVGCAVLMMAVLVIMSMFIGTVQTQEGARNRLDAKILGTIPHEKQLSRWLVGPRRGKMNLNVSSPNVSFTFAESIHRIASRFENEKAKGKSVFLLTSVSESEGKSTVAANVALSLAAKKYSVLFLDLDLRRPVQARHLRIKVPEELELGTMLVGGTEPQEILARVQTEPQTNLKALLSNKSYDNASELIASGALAQVIHMARTQYDYVIIDLPPIGYFPESEVMLDVADASVLVVRQDVIPATVINDNIDALREGKATFLGCILNDMNTLHPGGSTYGYSYRYSKYGYGRYGYDYAGRGHDSSKK